MICNIYSGAYEIVDIRLYANACWDGKRAHHFTMNNGVKQGTILAVILYCIYASELFKTWQKAREDAGLMVILLKQLDTPMITF